MLKPKYIENILSITKEKRGEIECDVVCECGSAHFIGYKNVIVRSEEEAAYEAAYNSFNEKYSCIRFGDENGVSYLYGMKGLFGEEILEKFECKQLDSTEIVKVKCAECGKEYILFDSRFHGYGEYTTNLIENFNKQIKSQCKKKVQFPNEASLERFICGLVLEYNRESEG